MVELKVRRETHDPITNINGFDEEANGVELFRESGGESEVVGYVPFEELVAIEPMD